MPHVFINYRTGDGEQASAHLDDALRQRFGDNASFRDGRSISLGRTFQEELRENVRACEVLLVLAGPELVGAARVVAGGRLGARGNPGSPPQRRPHRARAARPGHRTARQGGPAAGTGLGRRPPVPHVRGAPGRVRRTGHPPGAHQGGSRLRRRGGGARPGDRNHHQPDAGGRGRVRRADGQRRHQHHGERLDRSRPTTTHFHAATGSVHTGSGNQHLPQFSGDGPVNYTADNHGTVHNSFGNRTADQEKK